MNPDHMPAVAPAAVAFAATPGPARRGRGGDAPGQPGERPALAQD